MGFLDTNSFLYRGLVAAAVSPWPVYIVGGTVRDLLLGRQPKDLDLVSRNAGKTAAGLARELNAAFVAMEKKADEPCYRIVDRDDPSVYFDLAEMRGRDIFEDLSQRDFTINAIAMELNKDGSPGKKLDPLHGEQDLKNGIIRMTHENALAADPLRVLRAFRLSSSLGFAIEKATLREMRTAACLLSAVSAERVMTELLLILGGPDSARFFRQMDQLGILDMIFPEIVPMKRCGQNGYHHKDVWEHSLLAMEHIEGLLNSPGSYSCGHEDKIGQVLDFRKPALLKLSALFHDMGKPSTRGMNPDTGRITFYGHDKAGAAVVDIIMERMRMSNECRTFVRKMVAEHLRPLMLFRPESGTAAKIRWFRKMKDDALPVLLLSMADVMSSLGPESGEAYRRDFVAWASESVREYFGSLRAKFGSPLLINGDDLIGLGMKPGPLIGRVLAGLRTAQDQGEISNRDEAISLAERIMAEISA